MRKKLRALVALLGLSLAAPAFAEDGMPPGPEIPEPEVPLDALEHPSAGTLAIRALADFSLKHPELMGDPGRFWQAWESDPGVSPEAKAIIREQREIARRTGENLESEVESLGEEMREAAKKAGEEAERDIDALRKRVEPALDQLDKLIREDGGGLQRRLDGLSRGIDSRGKALDGAADRAE